MAKAAARTPNQCALHELSMSAERPRCRCFWRRRLQQIDRLEHSFSVRGPAKSHPRRRAKDDQQVFGSHRHSQPPTLPADPMDATMILLWYFAE
jgi:hypothetical protein